MNLPDDLKNFAAEEPAPFAVRLMDLALFVIAAALGLLTVAAICAAQEFLQSMGWL